SGQLAGSGAYTGITGFANITGSFKMAKNILVVGAIDSTGKIELPSSRGPAYDGRIKPDLMAFGQDGSSGAAAIVSGISILLQHAYQQQHHDSLPPAALSKAILINTADDAGATGPDFSSGYGIANAYEAVKSIRQSQFFNNSIQQGNTQSFQLNIPAGISTFKCTLVWSDPPAQSNAVKALVNDLDIELVHTTSGQLWQPWILNRAANRDSLQLIAIRGKDTLNNTEQITLSAPPPGNYTINIKGSRVANAQNYFIAYKADTANRFEWLFPMSADPVIAGSSQLVRWSSTFTGSAGTLQYSIDEGSNWQTIASNIDLSKNYTSWSAPDIFSTALLRMTINGSNYMSDTFVISKRINTQVGFNCADSFLFYWNKPVAVNNFRVYKLVNKFIEPVTVVSDSFYISATTNSRQFTIAPLVKNREGIKAYTFDYTTQGVGCYFKTFLAQLVTDKASLQLELGSLYRVNSILVQKLSGNSFTTIQTITNPGTLQFNLTDATLHTGVNMYRIVLQLADGRTIYSNTELVYYLGNLNYIVYPNPARITNGFRILQKEPVEIIVVIHDMAGRKLKEELHSGLINYVSTVNLQKGLYVISIMKDGKKEFTGKIVVQ
ncbi:MAG: S8 family peptidase, partial [Chitinophagaceae bacterium]